MPLALFAGEEKAPVPLTALRGGGFQTQAEAFPSVCFRLTERVVGQFPGRLPSL